MIFSILLTILKILGIIVLSILGLIILVLLLVLFVPIRYSLKGYRTGDANDPPVNARAYVSWLLHIVHVSIDYPNETIVKLRIFGIPIIKYPSNKEKKKASKPDKKESKEEDKKKSHDFELEDSDINDSDIEKSSIDDTKIDDLNIEDLDIEDSDVETNDSNAEKKSIFGIISDFANKIKCTVSQIYDKIKSLIEDTENRANRIKHNIHYYHRILTSELFERVFEKAKSKVFKLLKSILPRKFQVYLEAGFDDPYTTGEVLAISGMLYPLIGDNIHVQGNFEEQIIRGTVVMKGRIYGFSFLKIGLYYIFDRDLKRLIKLFKKEGKKHGRK